MKIIVTGSSGFLGSNLVNSLLKNGHKVLGIDLKKNPLRHKNFKSLKVNLSNSIKLKKVFRKFKKNDLVIHTAAKQPFKKENNLDSYLKVNFFGAKNLLENCNRYNIKKIIYCSSFSVYGNNKNPIKEQDKTNPRNTYGLSKLLAESLFNYYSHKNEMKVFVLRFDGIYGSKQNLPGFIKMSFNEAKKNNKVSLFNKGSLKRDYVYIEDAISAINLSIKRINKVKFKILNIGGGNPSSSYNIFMKIKRITNSNSKIILLKKNNKNFSKDIFMSIKEAKKFINYRPSDLNKNLLKMYKDEKK